MSENGLSGPPQSLGQPKGIVPPSVKPMAQYPFNGLTSSRNSSRGSSPSPHTTGIPASQLPPSRAIPSSQLPPNSINSVSQKVSQLSVQNQLLSNVNNPQFTSTPNETESLPKSNVNLGSGDYSPVTSKNDNKKSSVLQNFQEIPLNEEKTVSNMNHSVENNLINSQARKIDDGMGISGLSKTSNSNIFDNRPQMQPINFNNQLFHNDQSKNYGVDATSGQQIPHSQPLLRNVGPQSMGNQLFQSQNQRQSAFQPLFPQNSASHHFQNVENTTSNVTNQSREELIPNMPSQVGQNVEPVPFPKMQPPMNVSKNMPGQNLNTAAFPSTSVSQNTQGTVNRMTSNIAPIPFQNQRPSNDFPPQKQPMLPIGINQTPSRFSPAVTRPNFNLSAMGGQPQGNTSSPGQLGGVRMPMSQSFQNNQPPLPGMTQTVSNPPRFPPSPYQQPNKTSLVNQSIPQEYSPTHAKTAALHSNRYPAQSPVMPAQRVPSLPNLRPAYNQQYQAQPIQNQQYNATPSVGYSQPNLNQMQNPSLGQGVVNQGFSKLWGAENYDLLQTANILPPSKIIPPHVTLGNDTLNAANCSGEIFRSTITKIPESQSLLQKSRLPLGILIHPFKDLTQLSVIQCNVIVRCRACRTYINPFVFFVDSKRWKCNLCYRVNDLPEEFQYDPVSKTYGDPSRRPEIKSSTIEYIAPAEYMLRPPQPAVYLFLLDISRLAIESGYLNVFCAVLLDELVNLPGDSRTQVGFITYDSCLHFFSFAEGLSQPHEMMVLDIDDIFLPCPDNLLVNLKDRMELIRDFLNQLPTRYSNSYDNYSALGAALQAAHKMMSATGGRVTVFQASLPNIGPGALTPREDPNQRASAEVHNLKPANDFYKRLALDCSSQQIAVDLFIVNSQYVDIATISGISRFSGGCIHHFPLFKFGRPMLTDKLEKSFRRYITRKIGFEAVMRIRCTRGMSIHTFHGNFFVRSTDLLSLPNVNPDSGYGMQVSIDENLSDVESVCFQAALLYTSSKGERRIRVHTLCLPIVSTLHDVINSADQQCIVGLLAKMAVDRSIESSLSDAREAFINVAIDILSSYKLSLNLGSTPNGLLAPNCLKLLPLYISALLKNQAFRTGTSTRLDDRVKAMIDMKTKPLPWLMQNIYPDLFPVHNLEEQQVILNVEEEPVHVPPYLQLTSRLIDNFGAYLMDTGDHMMLYISSGVSQVFLKEGLGVPNFAALNDQMYEIPIIESETNRRLVSFINYLNEEKPYRATLQIIKDNSPNRGEFLSRLIEDRVENALSYHEFLQHIKTQVK